ncbi:arabinan endo-1,5-alpha-L-arabinosidase [Sphingobacterium sp. SGL-16]|uniref:arabinan endo-1,5-alpha-L-arabinosidase n=1 Tax=Sphingobacterium sp. SGL-16 TaxID=2710883 RepID=UPI0013EA6278|nr:arabinan endo-1,5-alpha-L-arabinosidase [Sphingobacterium sp. SGL-16]NGM71748.1 arabinan endo-1,5-alpha-L-arabinosidase [Sphingobacterium sp. SGL-16]
MRLKLINLLFSFFISISVFAQPTGKLAVHDPVMIKHQDTYYLFSTGHGIAVSSSRDMINWKREKPVFSVPPQWTVEKVPTFKGHIWAPDIAFFNGKYYLYYSVSAFGKNTSGIGVATNVTLDKDDPNFKWQDHGLVIQSIPGQTNWNAIDPNIILDKKGTPYMSFGSFWDGIKLVKLSKDGLRVEDDITNIPTIASRKKSSKDPNPPSVDDNPKDAGGNAIEAPFIFKHKDYYYLFVSIDYCCKGVNSTYKMIVGRSKNIKGPYLDEKGIDLAQAGGKLVLAGNENWHGVGHNAVVHTENQDYILFHGYDAKDAGRSKLLIKKITWDKQGWPTVKLN